ncbi:hypothetical protein L208DRAFT_1395802, partial [Tricholoma matsutake]
EIMLIGQDYWLECIIGDNTLGNKCSRCGSTFDSLHTDHKTQPMKDLAKLWAANQTRARPHCQGHPLSLLPPLLTPTPIVEI